MIFPRRFFILGWPSPAIRPRTAVCKTSSFQKMLATCTASKAGGNLRLPKPSGGVIAGKSIILAPGRFVEVPLITLSFTGWPGKYQRMGEKENVRDVG